MKGASVKIKLTAWITLLMAALFCLLLVFTLTISSSVAYRTSMDTLIDTVRSNLSYVSLQQDGRLQLSDEFSFYRSGVSTLIYSQNKSLLAGQLPVSFTVDEPFQNGLTRIVDTGFSSYLVSDLWLAQGWGSGIWIRGLMEAPAHREITQNLLRIAVIALPAFLCLTALGGWLIVKRSFSPLRALPKQPPPSTRPATCRAALRFPKARTNFPALPAPSTACSSVWRPPLRPSGSLLQTPPTSCAPPSPSSKEPANMPKNTTKRRRNALKPSS